MKEVKNGDSPCSTIESLPRKNRSQSAGESPLVDEHSGSIRIRQSPCVTHSKEFVTQDSNGGPGGPWQRTELPPRWFHQPCKAEGDEGIGPGSYCPRVSSSDGHR